jgi:hypothetical protein
MAKVVSINLNSETYWFVCVVVAVERYYCKPELFLELEAIAYRAEDTAKLNKLDWDAKKRHCTMEFKFKEKANASHFKKQVKYEYDI